MKKRLLLFNCIICAPLFLFAQHSDDNYAKKMKAYEDSLSILGKKFIHDEVDVERKNANYTFIKTLVSALKIPSSFNYSFDSLKTISILKSPDHKFRIFSWPVMNQDGSYRFYGAIQMNTPNGLKLYPLEDFSPFIQSAEDTLTNNKTWYGAQYYQIIPIAGKTPYYILLGWKGNNIKSTKKVIEVLSFKDDQPILGSAIFDEDGKTKKRVVFEYSRQASMLLKYVPDQKLIVFDHLNAPDNKMKGKFETYGPDLSYDGYQLKNGRWQYIKDLDMRNIPDPRDEQYNDPKKPINQPPKPKKK